jgi:KUP system potassium uptake protein
MSRATASPSSTGESQAAPGRRRRPAMSAGMAALTLGALGVVFGDIGTSPLYAVQAVFAADNNAVHVNRTDVYGVISLVFWSITIIVSVKYVSFVMRADDHGEGGIMALTALVRRAKLKRTTVLVLLVTLGIIGASLFYGDGAITPAISVLSAIEGLKVAVPSLGSLVLPIAVAVLCGLFAVQRLGTGVVGRLFGPVMAIWFGMLALIGIVELIRYPSIIAALSPSYAVTFLVERASIALIALAGVVLAVTGAEALYADMGHFGRAPIRRAWFLLVFPALTLNYLAQGSLILRDPKAIANPFYLLVPHWAQLPLVILATIATVIASQAVISGAFSVTQQAVQLGFLPRVAVRHTSEHEIGQIYVGAINGSLFVVVLAITIGFGSSAALASAYGVAVTGTFVLNTILFLAVARLLWDRPKWLIALGGVVFLTVEITFLGANLTKVVNGGWLPVTIAVIVFTLLMTWNRGRSIVTARRTRAEGDMRDFIEHLDGQSFPVQRVPGVAVFLNQNLDTAPLAMRANVERNHVLHDDVIVVAVRIERDPHIPDAERVVAEPKFLYSAATGDPLGAGAQRVTPLTLRFGFLDEPNVPAALQLAAEQHLIEGDPDLDDATYFLSHITIVPTAAPGMARWRKKVFMLMARNAANPAHYFRLPDSRTLITSGRIGL